MISNHYTKLALISIATASLLFSGCGGKKETGMSDHAGETKPVVAEVVAEPVAVEEVKELVAKPSTNSVYFAFDSSVIDDAGQAVLTEYAAWLNENGDVNIAVEGNCDERGSREYNLALGDRRANSVRSVLMANGVAGDRIDTVSFGEERPVCTRSGEACWAQNRRGDIVNH